VRRLGFLAPLLLLGCQPGESSKVAPAILPSGLALRTVLMVELQSGRDPEGTQVPTMLPEALVDRHGYTLIPAGTLAIGTVSKSRRGTAFTAVVNEPPRLEVRFETMKLPDGTVLEVTGDGNGDPARPYQFTQRNTVRDQRAPNVDAVMKDPDLKKTLEKLNDAYAEDRDQIVWGAKDRENLVKVAEKLQLPELGAELKKGGPDVLDRLTRNLISTSAGALTGGIGSSLSAALQAASIAGEAGRAIARAFVGPNIRAHVGTEVVLRLSREQSVQRIEASKAKS